MHIDTVILQFFIFCIGPQLPIWAHNKDSDKTVLMSRLGRVFALRESILQCYLILMGFILRTTFNHRILTCYCRFGCECPLGNLACFFCQLVFSNTALIEKNSEIPPECQTVSTLIRPDKYRGLSYYIDVDCQIELHQWAFLQVTSVDNVSGNVFPGLRWPPLFANYSLMVILIEK